MNERSKELMKQGLILLGWLLGTIGLVMLVMWASYNIDKEAGGPVQIVFLVALVSFGAAFTYFFRKVRPLFKDSTVRNLGCLTGIAGVFVAFLPLFIASATTPPGENMYSEASGGGSAIWLMIFSIPAGAVIGFFGLAIFNRNNRRIED